MGFPTSKGNNGTGKDNTFGSVIPEDERSNKGPTTSTSKVGLVSGRLTTYKSKVSDLNTGEWGVDTSTDKC